MLYVIARSEYMYEGPYMTEFVGTFRELLEQENGITEGMPNYPADVTDAELIQLFNEANGDGQPYTTVWSVEEHKQVLG